VAAGREALEERELSQLLAAGVLEHPQALQERPLPMQAAVPEEQELRVERLPRLRLLQAEGQEDKALLVVLVLLILAAAAAAVDTMGLVFTLLEPVDLEL
jgi:hypothetical protein